MFSVLMSVYKNETASNLKRCFQSLVQDQTLLPNEIVLVEDGPLTEELYSEIAYWTKESPVSLKSVKLKKNMGLGKALSVGLEACSYELVARMDTDDIALPDRFQKQIEYFEEYPETDILGGGISEFEGDENNIYSKRMVPLKHYELKEFAKSRCPFNHPTVMYKKESILRCGSYQTFHNLEDYYLWARMIKEGCIMANLDDILVNMRAGRDLILRRGGLKYALSELRLQKAFLKMQFISLAHYIKNICIRFPMRLCPGRVRLMVYGLFR